MDWRIFIRPALSLVVMVALTEASRRGADGDSRQPLRPVAIVAFHGTADAVNSYTGSAAPHWGYSIPIAIERWARVNGCQIQPESMSRFFVTYRK